MSVRWKRVRIGDICAVATGGTPSTAHPEYYDGDLRWLKSGDVKGFRIFDSPHRISVAGLENSNAVIHPAGTVLLAMSGQGRTRGTSAVLMVPSSCSQSVAAILPSEHVLPEILHFGLTGQYETIRRSTGDNERSGLNLRLVRRIEIPLPPLPEQRRIAARLEEQFAQIDHARAAAQAQLEAARSLTASFLRQIFESEEAQRWARHPLGTLAQTCSGTTPSRSRNDYYSDAGIPWVKTGELLDDLIVSVEESITQTAMDECSLRLLPERTLLIAMYGQGKTRGRTGLLTVKATTNQACFAILPNDAVFVPRFLQFWFQHSYRRLRSETEARGGNQPNLNGELLRNQLVPVPDLKRQKEIVCALEKSLALSNRLASMVTSQVSSLGETTSRLLHTVFN